MSESQLHFTLVLELPLSAWHFAALDFIITVSFYVGCVQPCCYVYVKMDDLTLSAVVKRLNGSGDGSDVVCWFTALVQTDIRQ